MKHTLRTLQANGALTIRTKRPQVPTEAEIERNPRARSAAAGGDARRTGGADMTAETFEYAIKKDVRNNPIVREVDRERHREMWRSTLIGAFLVLVLLFGLAALRAASPWLSPRADAANAPARGDQPASAARDRDAALAGAHRAHGDRTAAHGGAVGRGRNRDRACHPEPGAAAVRRRSALGRNGVSRGRPARQRITHDAQAQGRPGVRLSPALGGRHRGAPGVPAGRATAICRRAPSGSSRARLKRRPSAATSSIGTATSSPTASTPTRSTRAPTRSATSRRRRALCRALGDCDARIARR